MSEEQNQVYKAEQSLVVIASVAALVAVLLAVGASLLVLSRKDAGQVMAPASPGSAPSVVVEHNRM